MKIRYYYLVVTLIVLSLATACESKEGAVTTSSDLENKIDSLIPESITDESPGLVVGVVQNGEIVFSKGYGKANLAYNLPNDPEMVYNIGSVAKQFLGYAFASFHAEGKLDLDDLVSDHLDDWPVFDHPVTLRHLLTHTSGYREAYTPSVLAGRIIGVDRLSREECLNVVRRQPELEFVPGSRYTYNSTAWVILAEVFEKVAGLTAEEWAEANLFEPLGMKSTQIESHVGEVIYNAAESYSGSEGDFTNEKSNRAIFGAADIFTSVNDLARWINNYKTAQVGGDAVKEVFLDPFVLNDGTNSEYALGIGVTTHKGLELYTHTGGHEAFATQVRYYPEHDTGIVLISNYGGTGWIPAGRVAELVLGEFMTDSEEQDSGGYKVSAGQLEGLVGNYVSADKNSTFELTMSGDSLMIDGNTYLKPVSEKSFMVSGEDTRLEFDSDNRITLTTSNGPRYFEAYQAWSPDNQELQAYAGNYWSEELETLYTVEIVDGQLVLNHRWNGTIPTSVVTRDLFRSVNGFYLAFERNTSGSVTGFGVNSGRTLNMRFNRTDSY
jgi:CubicO group peptidase (beta-lactamase class C family)